MASKQPGKTATRLYSLQWRPGIRLYLIMVNVIFLCLLFPSLSIFFFNELASFRDNQLERTINHLHDDLKNRSTSLTRRLELSAEQAIAGYDYSFLNNLLHRTVKNDPELIYALVMDMQRRIVANDQVNQIGAIPNDKLSLVAQNLTKKDFTPLKPKGDKPMHGRFIEGRITHNGKPTPIMEVVMPVYSGRELYGMLRCGFSMDKLNNEIASTRQEWTDKMKQLNIFILTITAILFCIGLLVAFVFGRFFINSTIVLRDGIRRVAAGELTHNIPIEYMFCREFVDFAKIFNEMTAQLRSSLNKLDEYSHSLEHMVEDRTRELKDTQTELLQQAHESGMAEMAVGVLHNIGNAITPAKVETSLLIRRLRDSTTRTSLPLLTKELLRAINQPEQLPAKRKNRLENIIKLLPKSIIEEYDQAIDELSKICANHEHIEEIISLQMRYAHLLGESEDISLNQVALDALTMLADALTHRGILIEKQLTEIPKVRIAKAKMIQIVVNLIKNGYESMDDPKLSNRCLLIATSVEPGPSAQVIFSVQDSGCGFTEHEKEKMFKFGYTTKKSGSGFGLHSCANFLIANNGSLNASSKGKGQGAKFVVKLPASQTKPLAPLT